MTRARPIEPFSEDRARQLVAAHEHERGPLLPVLHALNDAFGCVDGDSVAVIAEALNLSEAEVFGVASFYRDFRDRPVGETVVRVCRGEACQAMGAESLAAHACERLGVSLGGTTADGKVTLEQVFCLGNCALSPAVMIDDDVFGRVDAARWDELVGPGE
ncbi:MAG TPA: formate dehydrogenase subunit gamma [Acidimicrobiales bacterium]|nr:formate dehydrogenase subunit gamma [Acidimicrobiales bacterium]